MFDVVVVTFAHEFATLLLQLRSIARSNFHRFISSYTIVWNDFHDEDYFDKKYRQRIVRELGTVELDWRVVFRRDLMDESAAQKQKGSRVQQLLKLLAVSKSSSKFCYVLDTKNHVIRDLDRDDFFSDILLPRSHTQSYGADSVFGQALHTSLRYFGVESLSPTDAVLPSTTPYMMHAPVVLEMISEIEDREGMDFSRAFMDDASLAGTTEFLLYYAYIKCHRVISDLYCVKEKIYVTFFNKSPSGSAAVQAEIDRIKDPSVKFLGLHRGRKLNMAEAERDAFVQAWLKAKLFADSAEAIRFIESGDI